MLIMHVWGADPAFCCRQAPAVLRILHFCAVYLGIWTNMTSAVLQWESINSLHLGPAAVRSSFCIFEAIIVSDQFIRLLGI
jgi:hypothetical protein